jgi:hypothetical protein
MLIDLGLNIFYLVRSGVEYFYYKNVNNNNGIEKIEIGFELYNKLDLYLLNSLLVIFIAFALIILTKLLVRISLVLLMSFILFYFINIYLSRSSKIGLF